VCRPRYIGKKLKPYPGRTADVLLINHVPVVHNKLEFHGRKKLKIVILKEKKNNGNSSQVTSVEESSEMHLSHGFSM